MSTMHRPKPVNAAIGPQIAPWSPSRPGAAVKTQTQRVWTLTWAIAAPASARGELVWTIETSESGRASVRCVLVQDEGVREVVASRQASLLVVNGLAHIIAHADQDGGALITIVIDTSSASLLYAATATLASLGVLGGRAEPPVLGETAPAAITRSASR